MATPSDPGESVPQEPPVVPEEAAAADEAQAEATAAAALAAQIRELATEIANQALLSYDPATIRKGIVTAIATTSTPPTLTITISGDATEIPGVRYHEHYVPVVGDVVHLLKQGTDLTAIGKVAEQYSATAWTTAVLGAGFSHNGNSGGNVQYRRVWDHGSWKMQWKGVAGRSSGTAVLSPVLALGYRPANLRPLISARTATGGANGVKLDFGTDGSVSLVGGTTAPNGGNTSSESGHSHGMENNDHDHGGGVSSEGSHTHGIANNDHNHGGDTGTTSSHKHSIPTTTHKHGSAADGEPGGTTSVNNHSHSIPTTTHKHGSPTAGQPGGTTGAEAHLHTFTPTVDDPVWISFNNIEYFLD